MMSDNESRRKPCRMSDLPLVAADARSLTEQLVTALQRRVERGEFAAGSKLPTEGELVAAYNVSRTVIREAMSQLRARGLVVTRRGIGTFARERPPPGSPFATARLDPMAVADVLALLEFRISLETEAAALAAQRRSDAHLARLDALLATIEDAAANGSDAADADFEFHLTVADATRNHFFSDLLQHLGRAIIPRTRIDSPAIAHEAREDYLRRVNREHQAIRRAIARGDSDAARAAMRTHLSNSRERLRLRTEQRG
jgi:GntR family transcriptional regulator, transcriptional repressor for pyruvate dehydrogenase complex